MMQRILYMCTIKKNLIIALLVLSGVPGCSPGSNTDTEGSAIVQKRNKYYIQLSQHDKSTLFDKASKIQLGDSWEHVKRLLGMADTETKLSPKKENNVIAIVRVYYAQKLDKELVNEDHDQMLRLVFNNNEELIEMTSNISGFFINKP